MRIKFRVNGTPAPQGSKRHVGGGRMVEQSKAVGPWREAVRAEAQKTRGDGPPIFPSGPVSVVLAFVLTRPRSHWGTGRNWQTLRASAPDRPTGRPDLDKLVRSTLDGLVMGGVIADDSQVVDLNAGKLYGAPAGVIVEVSSGDVA